MPRTAHPPAPPQPLPAYGSPQVLLLEQRLTRFLTREYGPLAEHPLSLADCGISSREGPMWEATETLMAEHYDDRPEFFAAILDQKYMAYTMAYYGETPEQINASKRSLEQAQEAKFQLISERSQIQGNERILNVGCGFGSLETFLLERYPRLEIIGMTPSQVQSDYLRARMADPSHPLGQGRFQLLQRAFDEHSPQALGPDSFDLVISIGLLEQIRNMQSLQRSIAALLKPGGRAFHHFITSKMVIKRFLDPAQTNIGLYFPGGRIWPFAEFASHTEHLDLERSWFVNGSNYWRTLNAWHRRFWDNIDDLHAALDPPRLKHWNDYFSLCKVCFAPFSGTLYGNGQYLFRKPQA